PLERVCGTAKRGTADWPGAVQGTATVPRHGRVRLRPSAMGTKARRGLNTDAFIGVHHVAPCPGSVRTPPSLSYSVDQSPEHVPHHRLTRWPARDRLVA